MLHTFKLITATLPADDAFLFSITQVMDLKQVRTTYIHSRHHSCKNSKDPTPHPHPQGKMFGNQNSWFRSNVAISHPYRKIKCSP